MWARMLAGIVTQVELHGELYCRLSNQDREMDQRCVSRWWNVFFADGLKMICAEVFSNTHIVASCKLFQDTPVYFKRYWRYSKSVGSLGMIRAPSAKHSLATSSMLMEQRSDALKSLGGTLKIEFSAIRTYFFYVPDFAAYKNIQSAEHLCQAYANDHFSQ